MGATVAGGEGQDRVEGGGDDLGADEQLLDADGEPLRLARPHEEVCDQGRRSHEDGRGAHVDVHAARQEDGDDEHLQRLGNDLI